MTFLHGNVLTSVWQNLGFKSDQLTREMCLILFQFLADFCPKKSHTLLAVSNSLWGDPILDS